MYKITYAVLVSFLSATFTVVSAEDTCSGEDTTNREMVGSFMSIVDGSPAAPDTPQAQITVLYNKISHSFQSQLVGGMVFAKTGIFCQSQLTVTTPALIVDSMNTQFQNAVSVAWEQRWLIDDGVMPTLSSLLSFQVPYNTPGAKVDITATAIAAKNFSSGVGYINASLESPNGFDANLFNWKVIVGYKHIISDGFEVFGDVFVQKGIAGGFEVAIEWDFTDGVSLGPGVAVVFNEPNSNGATDVTVGINLSRGF